MLISLLALLFACAPVSLEDVDCSPVISDGSAVHCATNNQEVALCRQDEEEEDECWIVAGGDVWIPLESCTDARSKVEAIYQTSLQCGGFM